MRGYGSRSDDWPLTPQGRYWRMYPGNLESTAVADWKTMIIGIDIAFACRSIYASGPYDLLNGGF